MARPKSNTINYFSHDATHGKTITILKGLYGIEGYGFWFQLLEILASTEDHFIQMESQIDLDYLIVRTGINPNNLIGLLDKLAGLNAINPVLLKEYNIIWCQKLVDRVADVYISNRGRKPPSAPNPIRKPDYPYWLFNNQAVIPLGNPQSKVKKSKVKKNKEKIAVEDKAPPQNDPVENSVDFDDNLFEDHLPLPTLSPNPKISKPRNSIAVTRYYELTKVRPNKVQIDLIDENVNELNLESFEKVIKEWLGHNWNKTNVADMIKCLNNGGVNHGSNNRGKRNTTYPESNSSRNNRNTAESWKT